MSADDFEYDPDCVCGHSASEHGQVFGGRCYYEGKAAGRCGCEELRIPVVGA